MSWGGTEREGDTESEAGSRLWAVSTEPDEGLELTNHEIMTWIEVRCITDRATRRPDSVPLSFPPTQDRVNVSVCKMPMAIRYKQFYSGIPIFTFKIRYVLLVGFYLIKIIWGSLGWLSRLRVRLRLRSWSQDLWVRVPHQAHCCQSRAPFRSFEASPRLCPLKNK